MKKHFTENLPLGTYDKQLDSVSQVFKTNPDNVLSLKIRPLREDRDNYENAYSSGWDYKDFREYLDKSRFRLKKIETDYTSVLIETKSDEIILYVEHETGPELIIEAVKISLDFSTTIIGFVLAILKIIKKNDDKHYKKEQGTNRIQAISIEERRKGKKVKLITIISIENADKLNITDKEIKKILKSFK